MMLTTNPPSAHPDRELVLTRLISASPDKVYRAWTEPALLEQWFAPLPRTAKVVQFDVRTGGATNIIMRGPAGEEFPNPGVILEAVPNERLVMTDAYTAGWEPTDKPFMTAIITFESESGQTRYTARVRHWSVEDRQSHEQMGFHEGWGKCTDQLAALAAKL